RSRRSTRARVAGATSARPLMTFETVGTDTPAASATSAIRTRPLPFSRLATIGKLPKSFGQFSIPSDVEQRWLDIDLDREGTARLACMARKGRGASCETFG